MNYQITSSAKLIRWCHLFISSSGSLSLVVCGQVTHSLRLGLRVHTMSSMRTWFLDLSNCDAHIVVSINRTTLRDHLGSNFQCLCLTCHV